MKKTVKTLVWLTVCAILIVLDMNAASSSFSAVSSNFKFDYANPSSGTFTCDMVGEGAAEGLTAGRGKFRSTVISADTVHVFSSAVSQNADKYISSRSNMVVDLGKKTMKSSYFTATMIDLKTGKRYYSRKATANGKFDDIEFNGTIITMKGSF